MRLFIFFLLGVLVSCNDIKEKNFVTLKKGDVVIEGDITNDTLYNDTIKYYDLRHTLIRKDYFENGKQEGISTEYYSNGNQMSTTSYSDGRKNGYNSYYDSMGKCFYRDYYYYDLIVGPVIMFDKEEVPKRYFFINLQNETLLDINYLNWNGIKEVYSNCINFTSNIQRSDSSKEVSILLYLIKPPKFSFEYSILKKRRESENDFKKVLNVKSNMPFKNIVLPTLPDEEHYVIGANIFDSLTMKETVIYRDL